jgi:hypothetical protein
MKRYQVRRWDERNTLKFKKYAFPLWFMMNLVTLGIIYAMTI